MPAMSRMAVTVVVIAVWVGLMVRFSPPAPGVFRPGES
jgi:hypothetical protein